MNSFNIGAVVRGGRQRDGPPAGASSAGARRIGCIDASVPRRLPRRQRRRLDATVAPGGPHLHVAIPHTNRH